jgi:hypothetical protein
MIIQLRRTGVVAAPEARLERARQDFARQHCVYVPQFLHPELATSIRRRMHQAPFEERHHTDLDGRVVDLLMCDDAVHGRLHFLVNDRRFFELLQRLTGCAPINCFAGVVSRRGARGADTYAWHDDEDGNNLLAMSLDLSDGRFGGGRLQVREADTGLQTFDGASRGPGDAFIFRIAANLEHQVTLISGAMPRTVFAGWFRETPDYRTWLAASVDRREVKEATWGRR